MICHTGNWKSASAAGLRRALAILLTALLLLPCTTLHVHAASSVTIGGDTAVKKGDTCRVTVTFSGEDLGRVDGQMTYDESILSYQSGGSSSGDNGYIELKDAGTGGDISFTIKFKAVGAGSSALTVSTNGVYNLEEEYIDAPSAGSTVTVEAVEATEETTEETTAAAEEETTEATEAEETTEPTEAESTGSALVSGLTLETMLLAIMIGCGVLILLIILLVIVSHHRRKKREGK